VPANSRAANTQIVIPTMAAFRMLICNASLYEC
jgi:hypothetical protein